MAIICPKCKAARPVNATNPDWQCPACGICYAKFTEAAPVFPRNATPIRQSSNIPWGKLFLFIVFGWCAWTGLQKWQSAPVRAVEESAPDIATLAAFVKPGDVVMYTTTTCVYCHEAAAWLKQNGFAFTECNMTISPACESAFRSYNADGTPFLVVGKAQMKNGFDSDEFLQLVQEL